jgi:aminoglycoside phosphotransferase
VWCDEKEAIIKNSQKSFKKPHRICFTHGELRPHNILILNGRLSGLVDWGTAGWFPEYWDYGGGCYIVPERWAGVFHRIFSQYEVELEVDDEIGNVPSAHPMAS